MTAVQTRPEPSRLGALTKVELGRFARHPVFLVGFVLGTAAMVASLNHRLDDYYGPGVIPAFFLGVFGMVAAFRLTRSLERSAEAMSTTPLAVQQRVGALLLACLLPAVIGLAFGVGLLTLAHTKGSWVYGTWAGHERVAIVLGQSFVAALGGPLLGVAAARWLRFPGAVVVPVVVVVTWVVMLNGYYASGHQDSTGWTFARLTGPFAFFTTLDTDSGLHRVESWRGSPWWYLVYLLVLCAAAVVTALLRDSEPQVRRGLARVLAVLAAVGVVLLVLAVVQGPDLTTVRSHLGVTHRS